MSAKVSSRRKRLSREESRAQTRTLLLDAAIEVCSRDGMQAARIDEIAEQAGFSTGAVYSNFAGKDDLLLAVFEERLEPRFRDMATPLVEADSAAEQGQAVSKLIRALLNEERPYLVLLSEFWAYAAREPQVRERFAAIRQARRSAIQAMTEQRQAERDLTLSRPADELAAGFVALATGLLFEGLVDPDFDAESVHDSIFSLLSTAAAQGRA